MLTPAEKDLLGRLINTQRVTEGKTPMGRYVLVSAREMMRASPISVALAWRAGLLSGSDKVRGLAREIVRRRYILCPGYYDLICRKTAIRLFHFAGHGTVVKMFVGFGGSCRNRRNEPVRQAFSNEISGHAAAKQEGVHVPRLIESRNVPCHWIREEIIKRVGHHVGNYPQRYAQGAIDELSKLYSARTVKFRKACDIDGIKNIQQTIGSNLWLRHPGHQFPRLVRFVDKNKAALQSRMVLPEVQAHGDFVPNNIIPSKSGVLYLADWENFQQSCLGYDLLSYFTYAYGVGAMATLTRFLLGKSSLRIPRSISDVFLRGVSINAVDENEYAQHLSIVSMLSYIASQIDALDENIVMRHLNRCEAIVPSLGHSC